MSAGELKTSELRLTPMGSLDTTTELKHSLKYLISLLISYFGHDSETRITDMPTKCLQGAIEHLKPIEIKNLSERAKPFSSIPEKKGWPIIGCMWDYYKNLGRTHQLLTERSSSLGPIFKETVGSTEIVCVSDLGTVDAMVASEGRHPLHFDVPAWLEYRRQKGRKCGTLTAQGEDWGRMRRAINKKLLRSKHVMQLAPAMHGVTDDFLDRLARVRAVDGTIVDLEQEVLRWALECSGTVLFDKRLGCFDNDAGSETAAFMKAACEVMALTQRLIYLPPCVAKVILPVTWRDHSKCWDSLFSIVERLVDERLGELADSAEDSTGFLSHIVSHGALTREEVYANVIELLLGGIHSTTKVVQWMLLELSKNPDVQDRLCQEASQRCAEEEELKPETSPYLQAVLRETLRLYPVAGGIPRILSEPTNLCGYHLPKGTNVMVLTHVIGRNADLFENPDRFSPERWLRNDLTREQKSFSNLPYGMGRRMCVGKRVAQTELSILLSKMSDRFRTEPGSPEPVEIESRLMLQPDRPVLVRLKDRT